MKMGDAIKKLREQTNMTQAQFAQAFGVSQQSVQKWESGAAIADLKKIVAIAKRFGVSLDALILGHDQRVVEELGRTSKVKPSYQNVHDWEFYASNLHTEYTQSIEEGLAIEAYKDVFSAVSRLPKGEIKKKMGDVLFEVVSSAKPKEGYPFVEPSTLPEIRELRQKPQNPLSYNKKTIENQILGAWMGRICGCLLGKTVEGIRTNELIPFLKETGNYPMHRYIERKDLEKVDLSKYTYGFEGRDYADTAFGMPVDDDTNYVILAQEIIERYGRDFKPQDVAHAWLSFQSKDAYCTAERVAFCNFVKGYEPPASAIYKNPYREWIGAQIRGDYFGYINPADPEAAAEMAFKDASISHIKNGIYGEMFASAMIATAAATTSIKEILLGGLGEIPATSRLYKSITSVISDYENGVSQKDCFQKIHEAYDEYTDHGWCHTISNAMIVAAALLYGQGDFGRSVCMAVETGFDTDCNGATVGSVLGMAYGIDCIDSKWTAPLCDTLHTSIFGIGTVKISARAKATLKHLAK